jgi:hypothetical protein
MSEKHIDRFELSLAGLMGRVMGQDMLIRHMLVQLVALQSAVSGRRDFASQRKTLQSWLDELTAQVSQIGANHPEADEIKRGAMSSIHINIGDIIQAIDEDANG